MKRVFGILLIVMLILSLAGCEQKEGSYDGKWALSQISNTINKSIDKGRQIKKMQLITEISPDVMYPENPPTQILSNFEAAEKDSESFKNLDFSYMAFYPNGKVDQVESKTAYKGFYLNVFYPCKEYNEIDYDSIKSIDVEKKGKITTYKIQYQKSHYSRRYEWQYAKVVSDYETFKIDEEGVIVDYEAVTNWKKDSKTYESVLRAKLVSYELFD